MKIVVSVFSFKCCLLYEPSTHLSFTAGVVVNLNELALHGYGHRRACLYAHSHVVLVDFIDECIHISLVLSANDGARVDYACIGAAQRTARLRGAHTEPEPARKAVLGAAPRLVPRLKALIPFPTERAARAEARAGIGDAVAPAAAAAEAERHPCCAVCRRQRGWLLRGLIKVARNQRNRCAAGGPRAPRALMEVTAKLE